jgi:pimeloyl-ACP methyl ester carboxylesterase
MSGAAFQIRFATDLRADLLRRLTAVRWSDAVTADWQYGTSGLILRILVDHWCTTYDFDAAEERLNSLPHTRTQIGGFGIHSIRLRGRGPNPQPVLLLNGWPSSFVEYRQLALQLADPAAYGGSADDASDVVMPTLPGFGFSDRPTRPNQVDTAELFHRLMTDELGYSRYLVSGTDIGAGVATRLALRYPESVRGIHLSAVADPPLTPVSPPLSEAEQLYLAQAEQWATEEGAYEHLHSTRPQTLAYALMDSPVGLASWIVEKFHVWSDHGANEDLFSTFPIDLLIGNLMVYWVTGTIGSSMQSYFDTRKFRPALLPTDHVRVPTAICIWPRDLATAPREWAERLYNVQQYTLQRCGGHFPAWEAPDAYALDLQRFALLLADG